MPKKSKRSVPKPIKVWSSREMTLDSFVDQYGHMGRLHDCPLCGSPAPIRTYFKYTNDRYIYEYVFVCTKKKG